MSTNLSILAVIPARSGSRRLPNKNIRPLAGRPLVMYTIDAAVLSERFKDIILSSDSSEILAIADEYSTVSVHVRPPELATDESPAIDTVIHILENVVDKNDYDAVMMLEPTSPFRTMYDIRDGLDLFDSKTDDGVISVSRFKFPPQHAVWVDDVTCYISSVFPDHPLITADTRTDVQKPIYHPNGGFYMMKTESLLKYRSWFKGNIKAYLMPPTVDIDTEEDWHYAEWLIERLRRYNRR